jgi:hypothetical protein
MPDYDQGTTLPAPPPLTAQFRRKTGADPAMWAAQFLAAYAWLTTSQPRPIASPLSPPGSAMRWMPLRPRQLLVAS